MRKRKILVIFGGKSKENSISIISALFAILSIDKNGNEITSLYLNKDGVLCDKEIFKNVLRKSLKTYWDKIVPSYLQKNNNIEDEILATYYNCKINNSRNLKIELTKAISTDNDLVFPIFHGKNGEDGSIQGMLEFLDIPYIGCKIAASAIGIDKELSKLICMGLNLPVLKYSVIKKNKWEKNRKQARKRLQQYHNFPIFIKPSNLGSSIGINRVEYKEELNEKIENSLLYDDKLIVEDELSEARELTIGVIGNNNTIILSNIGEFSKKGVKYFDFNAKYKENSESGEVPAKISKDIEEKIKSYSKLFFEKLGGEGFLRIDYFLKGDNIYFNEVNTISGFENNGTFVKIWERTGYEFTGFLDMIIKLEENKGDYNEKYEH